MTVGDARRLIRLDEPPAGALAGHLAAFTLWVVTTWLAVAAIPITLVLLA
jgi:hypothetical protein